MHKYSLYIGLNRSQETRESLADTNQLASELSLQPENMHKVVSVYCSINRQKGQVLFQWTDGYKTDYTQPQEPDFQWLTDQFIRNTAHSYSKIVKIETTATNQFSALTVDYQIVAGRIHIAYDCHYTWNKGFNFNLILKKNTVLCLLQQYL